MRTRQTMIEVTKIVHRLLPWGLLAPLFIFCTLGVYLMSTTRTSSTRDLSQPQRLTSPHKFNSSTSSAFNRPDYTRTLIVAKLREDHTSWVDRIVDEDPYLAGAVYTVDDANAPLTVPRNKGHEVMVYLTYIIDHYFELSDISIFMHASQFTWHNNDFLDSDSARMVQRLRGDHVLRNGYMNLRCHREPGCPDHLHPTTTDDSGENNDLANTSEAAVIGNSWRKLFPGEPVPTVLSQPCCGQFAVSADRIRSVSLSNYVTYRNWLLDTPLDDNLSGRVWEYIWQFLFTGEWEFCPEEILCYCQGYGVCFEEVDYKRYFQLRDEAWKLQAEIDQLIAASNGNKYITPPSADKIGSLKIAIAVMHQAMDEIKSKAVR